MNTHDQFEVRFWGVRGGYPVPGTGTVRVGGNTTCLEVRAGEHLIIIDAGTGIIGLGREMVKQHQATGRPIIATLLFTHTHHDHTQGWPFFIPARLASSVLYIFGPKMLHEDLEDVLARAMLPPVFPLQLEELACVRTIRNIGEQEMILLSQPECPPEVRHRFREAEAAHKAKVVITTLQSYAHPKGGALLYKIEYGGRSLVFATDTEDYVGHNQRLAEFARGTDLLIHDAEYTPEEYLRYQGWGHSSWEMAVAVGQAAGVGHLALTHHNALHDDDLLEAIEAQAQERFAPTILAREGLTIKL